MASIIALKLRDRFPETRCWAFCPPGQLCDMYMAASIHSYPCNGLLLTANMSAQGLCCLSDALTPGWSRQCRPCHWQHCTQPQ